MKTPRFWALVVVASAAFALAPAPRDFVQNARQENTWARWKFLIGDWTGLGSGKPGEGAGWFSFAMPLSPGTLDGDHPRCRDRKAFCKSPNNRSGFLHSVLLRQTCVGQRHGALTEVPISHCKI